jgi:hypothetical protein
MYLIGILIWGVVAASIAWLLARLLTRRAKTRWWARGRALILMPVIFIAPMADEIVGNHQFNRLCEEAKEVKIYGTHPVGEELYMPDGQWRRSYVLHMENSGHMGHEEAGVESNRLQNLYESLVRHGETSKIPEVVSAAVPIRKYHERLYDNTDGRLLAEWTQYGRSGGWIVRKGFLGETSHQCIPLEISQDAIKFRILPFSSKENKK